MVDTQSVVDELTSDPFLKEVWSEVSKEDFPVLQLPSEELDVGIEFVEHLLKRFGLIAIGDISCHLESIYRDYGLRVVVDSRDKNKVNSSP
ncbi:MAG: hypothetical protein ABFD64_07520 [Armatimonadota bacterium]